jgi:hypothetical protein
MFGLSSSWIIAQFIVFSTDRQFPISPSVDRLFPTVTMCGMSLNANFGDNPTKNPFVFDIKKCPGMDLK